MKKAIRLITLCSFFMVFCLFSSVYAQNVWTEASSNQDVFFGTQNKVTSDLHASKTYKLDVAALKKQLEKAPERLFPKTQHVIFTKRPTHWWEFELLPLFHHY